MKRIIGVNGQFAGICQRTGFEGIQHRTLGISARQNPCSDRTTNCIGIDRCVGADRAGVGDVANFLFGCAYVVPAGLIYRFHHKKSRAHAVAGMAVGTVLTAILACFVNAFVLLPAYGKAFGMPIETYIQMGSAVHSSVNGLLTFALLIIAPFNIFKYALTSLIVFVIYKKIRVVLKGD